MFIRRLHVAGLLKKGLMFVVISVPFFYLLLSLVILYFIQRHDYESIKVFYADNWPTAFDSFTFFERCLTPQWYAWMKEHARLLAGILIVAVAIYFLLLKTIIRPGRLFVDDVQSVLSFMIRSFTQMAAREKLLLLLLFVAIGSYRLYNFWAYTPHTDEVFSYLFFARQGTLFTITNYVSTNNHIFLNAVCSIFAKISFLGPKWVMRLPVMVSDIAFFYGVFCLVKHFGDFTRAWLTVAGTAFCFLVSLYSVHGRGYEWQMICSVVSLGACWWCFFSGVPHNRKGYGLFIAASVAGFYINPLFIYHFLALVFMACYLFGKHWDRSGFYLYVRSLFLIGLITFTLYLPLIFVSSWNSMVNNGFISGYQSLSELAKHISDLVFTINYMLNYGRLGIFIFPMAFVFSIFLYFRGYIRGVFYKTGLIYFLFSVLSMFLVTAYQKVFPIERALTFWIVLMDIIFINVLYDGFRRFFPSRAVQILSLFVICKAGFSLRPVYWPRYAIKKTPMVDTYYNLQHHLDQLNEMHPGTWQITHSDDWYSMYLRFYLCEQRKRENIIWNRSQAIGDIIFLPEQLKKNMDLKGYKLWAGAQITEYGRSLNIYVKDGLFNK